MLIKYKSSPVCFLFQFSKNRVGGFVNRNFQKILSLRIFFNADFKHSHCFTRPLNGWKNADSAIIPNKSINHRLMTEIKVTIRQYLFSKRISLPKLTVLLSWMYLMQTRNSRVWLKNRKVSGCIRCYKAENKYRKSLTIGPQAVTWVSETWHWLYWQKGSYLYINSPIIHVEINENQWWFRKAASLHHCCCGACCWDSCCHCCCCCRVFLYCLFVLTWVCDVLIVVKCGQRAQLLS